MRHLLLLILLLACNKPDDAPQPQREMYFPPLTGQQWETLPPQELGWKPERLDALKTYLQKRNTKAFIILKDGRMVAEWYFGSFRQDSLWYWASTGKTLTAFLVGLAQQEGRLSVNEPVSRYLGNGWSGAAPAKEALITVRHQLSMTTGLNDGVPNSDCTLKPCLLYLADAGTRWAYHNAPYSLLEDVLEQATSTNRNLYTDTRLETKIGMQGLWVQSGFNNVYFSNARSMARFGLLILNKGTWAGNQLMTDQAYFNAMITPSQTLNPSYGLLWWLNGQKTYMLPQVRFLFRTDLIPTAPADLVAALGKNDQKIYVVPSTGMVVIRMGEHSGESMLALSSFDTELWKRIGELGN